MVKPRLVILIPVLVGIAVIAILFSRSSRPSPESAIASVEAPSPILTQSEVYRGPDGNAYLVEHGLPESTAAQDLKLVGRVVDGMHSLFKELDTRHVATNEQLSAFLTGANPEGLQYLDTDLPIFQNGLLCDRWGQAYIVHPLGTGQIEIRTIGADGIPYSDDDLVLQP
ncbi:MAG: hypothetical protein NWS71_05295 [Opitutales bacterium]|nr:hypothetical protein [Opitutales bacterium]MDP4778098.1 hypothetical protein [Opitutales bacterium]MDP4883391.1 hypothetical protein [Opitutales bacterium]MDP5079675.1 hypothetical protein [Opitutales bacterium]